MFLKANDWSFVSLFVQYGSVQIFCQSNGVCMANSLVHDSFRENGCEVLLTNSLYHSFGFDVRRSNLVPFYLNAEFFIDLLREA